MWTDEDEQEFQSLIEESDWRLGDDGTLETVLICRYCGNESVFQTREDALAFLDIDDGACYRCEEKAAQGDRIYT